MTQKSIREIQLTDIFEQVSAQTKVVSIEQCEAVWECLSKTIISNVDSQKSVLLFDMFYVVPKTIKSLNAYQWIPTIFILQKCHISYEEPVPQLTMVTVITKQKIGKNFAKQEVLNTRGNPQQMGWGILEYIFKILKKNLTGIDNTDINIGYFGILRIQNGFFKHAIRQDKSVRIKKLMTPRKRSSNLKISRRNSQNILIEEEASQNKGIDDLGRQKKSNLLLPLAKSINFLNMGNRKDEFLPNHKEKSFMNNLSVPDTRISNDLLGAGIDPLKFDYNYSKLVNQTNKLFQKTFTKPKPAKLRHPGVIDKFERTTGVPQTGLKVSNSVIVRIGSNYNIHAKNIYLDIKQKSILFVPRQPKITLTQKQQIALKCASEQEQYKFVTQQVPSLQKKVEERARNYKRYQKYINNYIDNSNVSPISQDSIKRILEQVRSSVKDFKSEVNVAIADRVINEANEQYYRAYKKSMLDYILKDQKQRERTGIQLIFKPPIEWGQNKMNTQSPLYTCKISKNIRARASKLLNNHLFHPKCVLQIANFNLKMKDLDLFRMKNQDNKPVNVLYFIKKQNTHIADIMSYLSSDWIKLVSQILQKHVDFQQEPQSKTSTFIKLINVMLSNTLKNIVYQSFNKLVSFFKKFSQKSTSFQPPILQISIMDQNGVFVLSDDFRTILTDQIRNLIATIIEQSKKIHGVQFYLKDESNSFLWSLEKEDNFYQEAIASIVQVIDENCVEIDQFKADFKKYEVVLKFQQETIQWLKTPRNLQEIDAQDVEIKNMEALVQTIPYCFTNRMVLIQCFDRKEKLKSNLAYLKSQIHLNLKTSVQKSNFKSYSDIEQIKRTISSPIQNTFDYMKIASQLQQIRKRKLNEIVVEMNYNKKCFVKLLEIGYGPINPQLMEKIFTTNKILRSLNSKIDYHEDRLNRQKIHLESKVREKIKSFQIATQAQLTSISARIDEFQLRRVYNDYLVEMNNFKSIVQGNNQTAVKLNKKQENLKWNKSVFKAAEELKNIVMPNYDLWVLVSEYDCLMKEWKNKEISQMDVAQVKKRVEDINIKVSKTIKKLKNLSSLKVAYELQKDTKDILSQHVQIIEIFSHPGLKQRHWQLFNTKLMIPGVDLKQIPYSKIKIFEEYEKNLKVLSVISSQAAKQFQIQNQRNEQQQYWMSVSFETYSSVVQNNFCLSQNFLAGCLSLLEEHSNKLAVMKNYLYSKALYQQLQEWELWLESSKKNLQNLKMVQSELSLLRPIFSYDQIAKQLPIENSQFQSIDNYWKTLTKKIWEHSKLYEFMKSPKVSEMIEDLLKKIQILKRGIPLFLMAKRSEFPRFYFVTDSKLINFLVKAAYPATEKEAISLAFNQCFAPSLSLIQTEEKFIEMRSQTDTLVLTIDVYQLKTKKRLCQNLTFLEKCMRESVRSEVLRLFTFNFFDDSETTLKKYSLTSIFCFRNICLEAQIKDAISRSENFEQIIKFKRDEIFKLKLLNKKENLVLDKKVIKIDKIILGIIGEIDKIRSLQKIERLTTSSFQYLSMAKFVLKTNFQPGQIVEQNLRTKQPKQKMNTVCQAILNLRRSGQKNQTVINSSRVQIQVFNKSLEFNEQFWGDETHNYTPAFTTKANFLLLKTVMQGKIGSLCFEGAAILVRKLAIMSGQPFVELDSQFFGQEQGISCILHGMSSSQAWIFLQCSKLNLKYRTFDKINSLASEKKEKKDEIKESSFESPIISTFIKCFSEICNVSFNSACFLNFSSACQFQQIPKSFRSQMRQVVLILPPFLQYIKKESQNYFQHIQFGKQKPKYGLNVALQLTSFYQKAEKSKVSIKLHLNLLTQQQNLTNLRTKSQILQQFISNTFRPAKSSKQAISFINQTIFDGPLDFPDMKQPTIVPSSLLKQKEKTTFQEIYAKAKDQLQKSLQTFSIVVVYGSFDIKNEVVSEVIKSCLGYAKMDRALYSFPACIIQKVNISNFMQKSVEMLVSQLNRIFLQKSYKKLAREGKRDIYLHFQHLTHLEESMLSSLIASAQALEQRGVIFPENLNKNQVNIKVIIDCIDIGHMGPSTALRVGKVFLDLPESFSINQFYCDWVESNIKIDKQRSEDSRVNYDSVMSSVKYLQPTFAQITNLAIRALNLKQNQSQVQLKYIMTLRFLRMFKIYIDHLDDKQIDEYVDYDVNSYINNSFVYCVYWTICVGFLKPHEHFIVEQALLKEHFPEITDIEEVSKYMLNQENQWLNWSSLKQEFTLADIKNVPIYNIWVSTDQNMKIYTNVIKLLEKGLRVLVVGQRCSGKSTLLKQISNFEMSYTSFLIDCHRLTRVEDVSEVIKNRIFFTKVDKKLILIDDVCLPLEDIGICQVIKKLMQENILCSHHEKGNYKWKNKFLKSNISVLMTASDVSRGQIENSGAFGLIQAQVQRFNIKQYQQSDISTIYAAYIGYQFDRLKIKIGEKPADFEGVFTGFLSKIYRKFNIEFHTLNKIVKLFITKLNIGLNSQKKEEQSAIQIKRPLSYLEGLKILNRSIFTVLGQRSNFEAITNICMQQTNKPLSSGAFKNHEQFFQKINGERYNQLPATLSQYKSVNGQPHNFSDRNLRQKAEIVGSMIQEYVAEKNEGIKYIPTTVQTQMILKLSSLLKICPSHVIILSQVLPSTKSTEGDSKWIQANGFGIRTMVKIVSFILAVNFNEIQNQSATNFINDSLNIIKAGGKVDESLYYLSRNQFKNVLQCQNNGKEIISTINSFICSPELFEFFTQQRIQQIFVKFSSQKKTLKRSEFIRKVREKIHLLFHFIISMDMESFNFMSKNYPNLTKQCHIIHTYKLPEQNLCQIANKILRPEMKKPSLSNSTISHPISSSSFTIASSAGPLPLQEQKQRRSIVNSLLLIYGKFQSIMKARFKEGHPDYYVKYKMKGVFEYFQIFRSLKKKYEELNKKQENNGQLWGSRRKQTQQKYQQLRVQKDQLMKENEEYFRKQSITNSKIQQLEQQLLGLAERNRQIQTQHKMECDKLKALKHDNTEHKGWHQYQELLDLEQEMSGLPHEEFQQLYKNPKLGKKLKVLILNSSEMFDLDYKTNILEGIQRLRMYRMKKIESLMEQFLQEIKGVQDADENECEIELESCFVLWQKQYIKLVDRMKDSDQQIQEQQEVIQKLDQKIKDFKSKNREIQEQIQNLKQELNRQFTDSNKIMAQFQEISKSLNQIEPILNIFKHFEKVIRAKNNRKDKEVVKDSTSVSRTYASLIMATVHIAFAFYLNFEDQERLWLEAKEVIKANGLRIDDSNIFDIILNEEQIFKNKYGLMQSNDSQTVCQIGLNSNTCSILRANDDQILSFYRWLEHTTERTIKIVQNSDLSQINECLTNGHIGLLVNPSILTLKKLKPLINNEIEVKNNAIYMNITEEIIINPITRIVIILTPSFLKDGRLVSSGVDNLWHLVFHAPKTKQQLENKIKQLLNRNRCQRSDLVQEHLHLFQQLSKIDKKIQKMIMTIRKNNQNPDRIIMKIETISEEKQVVMTRMEQIVEQLEIMDKNNGNLSKVNVQDRAATQICQLLSKNCGENGMLMRQFHALIDYLKILVNRTPNCNEIIKQKLQQFAQLFMIQRRQRQLQSGKFTKIQASLMDKFENILKCPLIQTKLEQNKWYSFLDTIFNLEHHSQKLIEERKEVFKITLNNKTIDQSTTSAPISSIVRPNKKQNRNIFVYRTEHIDTMSKYLLSILLEKRHDANWKQINSLMDYNAKNVTSQAIVNIVQVRNQKDWKYISSYIQSEEEKTQKKGNQFLIVLCDKTMDIPPFLEPKVFSIDSAQQVKELTAITSKLQGISKKYQQRTVQIKKEVQKNDVLGLNEQQIVEETLYISELELKVNEKGKYLATVLTQLQL